MSRNNFWYFSMSISHFTSTFWAKRTFNSKTIVRLNKKRYSRFPWINVASGKFEKNLGVNESPKLCQVSGRWITLIVLSFIKQKLWIQITKVKSYLPDEGRLLHWDDSRTMIRKLPVLHITFNQSHSNRVLLWANMIL